MRFVQALLNDFEFEFLRTLSDPIRAVQTMLLTKLLSNHAQDEEYLAGPQNDWISVRFLCILRILRVSASLNTEACSMSNISNLGMMDDQKMCSHSHLSGHKFVYPDLTSALFSRGLVAHVHSSSWQLLFMVNFSVVCTGPQGNCSEGKV